MFFIDPSLYSSKHNLSVTPHQNNTKDHELALIYFMC